MAVTTPTPAQVRPRREREEELLVWPDLVFVEFICAVLFTFGFTVISALINAPLINRANPDVTPNPSKAPWYFLNLQELLLHMNPALAGVVVPTVALIVLAAVPYIDRSKEGQGVWFGTKYAVRISVFSAIFATVLTLLLIGFDSSKQVQIYDIVTGKPQGTWVTAGARPHWLPKSGFVDAAWDLAFSDNLRAIQTEWKWKTSLGGLVPRLQRCGATCDPTVSKHDGTLDWPQDFTQIPIPFNLTSWPWHAGHHGKPQPGWWVKLPGWFTGLLPYDLNLNLPAFIVEQLIPSLTMTVLPAIMVFILWRIGWVNTRRDVMLAIFSGFITVYWVMTIVGAGFRGPGQLLVPPWDVPRIDG